MFCVKITSLPEKTSGKTLVHLPHTQAHYQYLLVGCAQRVVFLAFCISLSVPVVTGAARADLFDG